MSVEDLATYVKEVKEKNKKKSIKYYVNKIKINPEKYQNILDNCKKIIPNITILQKK
jgi:hypothetical protein